MEISDGAESSETLADQQASPNNSEAVQESERVTIKVVEQLCVEEFGANGKATINDLRTAICSAMDFPVPLQTLWPTDTLLPIKGNDYFGLKLKLKSFHIYPILLTGRRTLNSVPPAFLSSAPPTSEEHAEALQVATTLNGMRFSRAAVQDGPIERTTIHGVEMKETTKLQKRFKRLVPMDGPEAKELAAAFEGQSWSILDAYIGTGIVPRLYCDHIYGPFAPSCRSCSILFVVEWVIFTRHITSTFSLLFGQHMCTRPWDEKSANYSDYLSKIISNLDELIIRGVRIDWNCPLADIILELLEDLDVYGYLAKERCSQDGVVDDIESFFQILEFLLDVPDELQP